MIAPAAVVFDYGGVLTTPVRDSIAAWLTRDGIDPASFSRTLKAWMSRSVADGTPIHRLETGELSAAEFEALLAAELVGVGGGPVAAGGLLDGLFADLRPDPAMFELVAELRTVGVRVALLSNSWGNSYPRDRIDALFDPVVISSEIGMRKPDPEIFEHTLGLLGVQAADAVFVDDAAQNVAGAQRSGLHTVRHVNAATTRHYLARRLPGLRRRRLTLHRTTPRRTVSKPRRTAIVTGAARGIGAATAQRLSRDGLAVAVLDLDAAACRPVVEAIESTGGTATAVAVDVADEAAVAAAVDRVAEQLGEPTVLVNNAGITRDNLMFKMTADDWDAVMGVHLRGSFLMSRATQKYMTAAGWGRIVNLSSISALGNRGQANYAAAKAGLQGFTKTLAIELGKFGVTVNAIAPGFIETEMTADTAARVGVPFEEYKAAAAAQIPVARVGQPEDIAATVSFFAGEEASFVSGQILYVAGGPCA